MILYELSLEDRKHWELHLKAVVKDTPALKTVVDIFLAGGELPNIKHRAYVHDWLEKPGERLDIEALNG